MAKGKGKGGSSGGPRKSHGPKRRLFKDYKPMIHAFAEAGLLDKYHNYESFCLACGARGKRNPSMDDFKAFSILPREKQDEYFASMKK